MPHLIDLRPRRPASFIPAPILTESAASRLTPTIEAQARALGLAVSSQADPAHHSVIYSFSIADDDETDPLYVAKGPHSAFRFLDHHATRH